MDATSTGTMRESRFRLLLLAETLLAAAVVAYRLGARSFWLDEAYTWSTIDRPFGALVSLTARDEGYQILHQFVLWPWARVSTSEGWLRVPSALAFVATVPVIAFVGRRQFGAAAGAVAGALFAVHGFSISLAQEARSYPFATLFTIAALGTFVVALDARSARARRWWVATATLAVWSHGFAALAVGAPVLLLPMLARSAADRRAWRRPLIVAALLNAIPLLLPFAHTNTANDYAFLGEPSLRTVVDIGFTMLGRAGLAASVMGIGMIAAAWRWMSRAEHRNTRSVVWATILAPYLVLGAVSLIQPIWLDRYFAVTVPAICLVVAEVSIAWPRRWMSLTAIALVIIASAAGAVRATQRDAIEDWRGVSRSLRDQARTGDALLFSVDEERIAFEYYLRDDTTRDDLNPRWPAGPWGSFSTGDQGPTRLSLATARAALASRPPRVWVIDAKAPAASLDLIVAGLDGYQTSSTETFEGVRVLLLVRDSRQ
jgi:mannosyltransferase